MFEGLTNIEIDKTEPNPKAALARDLGKTSYVGAFLTDDRRIAEVFDDGDLHPTDYARIIGLNNGQIETSILPLKEAKQQLRSQNDYLH